MSQSLKITVHEASRLEDVERFGKNDPYARVGLDLKGKFVKTKTINNAGKEAAWNQTLTIESFDPQTQPELYVEVLDEETTADEPIAFTTIPLHQVLSAQGHAIRARFDLYTVDGKQKGEILLTIVVVAPGQTEGHHPSTEIRGATQLDTAHHSRIKGLKRKESAADAATLAVIGGALFGAKALHDASNDKKKLAHEEQEAAKAENREY
ncbi:MAG: C2 domain-containing protein [Linnemannia gamsii]|nr:MAG: C2 domain-containing protein [Linnemannia gamsii]